MGRKDIVEYLQGMDPSSFQQLGDRLLPIYKKKYENLIPKGNHIYENKTIKGTPDSYKYIKDKIIAVQYTTSSSNISTKLKDDIRKVIKWSLFKDVNEIVLFSNSRQNDVVENDCRELIKIESNTIELEIIWIDHIIKLIEDNYDAKAILNEYFKIDFIEIILKKDFKNYYYKTYRNDKINFMNISRDTILDEYKLKSIVINENRIKVGYNCLVNIDKGILYGKSGEGKSYILKDIFIKSFSKCNEYSVYIDLNQYNGQDIVDLLKRNLECCGIEISIKLIEEYLNKGNFFLILDGFDEISRENRNNLINYFFNNNSYRNNRFLLSSRYNIKELDKIQYSEKIYIQGISVKKLYKKVIRKVIPIHNDYSKLKIYLQKHNLQKFITNSLNLTFLVNILKQYNNQNINDIINQLKNESALYEKYIEICITKEIKKQIHNNILYRDLKKVVLFVAYFMVKELYLEIEENELDKIIDECIKVEKTQYKIEELKNILINTVLVYYKGKFKFVHKNLEYYLVSEYIDNKDIWLKKIDDKLYDEITMWKASLDKKFIIKYLDVMPENLLKKILSEVENENVCDYLIYIKLLFSNKYLNEEAENKLFIIYDRFRYDERVLDIVFEFLKKVDYSKESFDSILKNNKRVEFICNRCGDEYIFDCIYIHDFFKNHRSYNVINKRWILEGNNNKLIRIVSFFILSNAMNDDYYSNDEEILGIYTEALKGTDEELLYNALVSVKRYIYIDDRFSILNILGMSLCGKKLLGLFKSIDRQVSDRVKKICESIDEKIKVLPKDSLIDIFNRITCYKKKKDLEISIDFARSREICFYRDEIIEKLGKEMIGDILVYSFVNSSTIIGIDYVEKILDSIYYFNLNNSEVLNAVLKVFHEFLGNTYDTNYIKTDCLKILCGRISIEKLKTLKNNYDIEENEENKVLLTWGMFVVIKSYRKELSFKFNDYLDEFSECVDNYKMLINFDLRQFLAISVDLWEHSVYIKDYDNDSEFWSNKYRTFFYYMIDNVDKRIIIDLCYENEGKSDKYEDILIDIIKVTKNRELLSILKMRDYDCWNRRINEIKRSFDNIK